MKITRELVENKMNEVRSQPAAADGIDADGFRGTGLYVYKKESGTHE